MMSVVWGFVCASSLVLGALLAIARRWSDPFLGKVLAFGAGALISSVSFELAEQGLRTGGAVAVSCGLAAGALAYYLADRAVERWQARSSGASAGTPLAVGALLDGIPEQMVLGIGLSGGGAISVALLVAIFVSNLPESIGSASDMLAAGRSRRFILGLWCAVALACTAATAIGYAAMSGAGAQPRAAINGFAAGALLVMLVDSMVPEATQKTRETAGLFTVAGFALAAGLSLLA